MPLGASRKLSPISIEMCTVGQGPWVCVCLLMTIIIIILFEIIIYGSQNPISSLKLVVFMLFYKPNGLLVYEAPKNPRPDFGVQAPNCREISSPTNIGRARKIKGIMHTWNLEGDLWERRRMPLFLPSTATACKKSL